MKNVIYILFILFIFSCKPIKYVFDDIQTDIYESIYMPNERGIIFTRDYFNDKLKIKQNDSVIFEEVITTKSGIAKFLKADKNSDIVIYINDTSPFVLTTHQMANYRHVYIYHNKRKIYVHFTDKRKHLYGDNTFFPSHTSRIKNCKIIAIDSSSVYYVIKFKEVGILKNNKLKSIITPKIDTLISTLPKIKVGNTYQFDLDDLLYNTNRRLAEINNKDTIYVDENLKISVREKDVKFYTSYNLIGLYYKKSR